jgi:phosphoenolpyruvate carboxykinase (GTP)
MRVLEWIVGRCHGRVEGVETALGIIPRYGDLQWQGLERFTREQYEEIVRVDGVAWRKEVESHDELLGKLGAHLPREIESRRTRLHQKLAA